MKHSLAVAVACIAVILAVAEVDCTIGMIVFPDAAQAVRFIPAPKDRPVLETIGQVRHARATGVCKFDFGGTSYILPEIPKEYVDYSAWYVRMP